MYWTWRLYRIFIRKREKAPLGGTIIMNNAVKVERRTGSFRKKSRKSDDLEGK